jgi:cell pole-organizing protein PopZ
MGQISHEPSMEDILASIKRIIAEDSEAVGLKPQRGRRDPAEEGDRPATAEVQPFPRAVPQPVAAEEEPEPADVLELTSPMTAEADPAADADLLSDPAREASRNAFAALAQRAAAKPSAGQASAIEGFVAELLRPMLKDWLDRELPRIVERLVKAEIEKVSGRN